MAIVLKYHCYNVTDVDVFNVFFYHTNTTSDTETDFP